MEYGAAAAVARWTMQGKWIGYVLASDGEAGIASMPPDEAAPIRRDEQRGSYRVVGVTDVEFLGHPDATIVEGIDLRADLAVAVRRHRPKVSCRSTSETVGAGRAGTSREIGSSLPRDDASQSDK